MDTYREYEYLNELWSSGKAAWKYVGMTTSFWQDRPTLVTGATGLLGSFAGPQADCGRRGRGLSGSRLGGRKSEFVRSGTLEQVKVVRGDVRDQAGLERVLGEYEVDTVFHLGRQTIVQIANR
jgi:CDP-glucose 4,6-dehydratase